MKTNDYFSQILLVTLNFLGRDKMGNLKMQTKN